MIDFITQAVIENGNGKGCQIEIVDESTWIVTGKQR